MEIVKLNENNINARMNGPVVIYGAGRTGGAVVRKLSAAGITIDYVVDDDPNKWGKSLPDFADISIDSFDLLRGLAKSNHVNLVITTMYGGLALKKLRKEFGEEINGFDLYDAIDFRLDDVKIIDEVKNDYKKFKEKWDEKLGKVIELVGDEESKCVMSAIKQYLNNDDREILKKICSIEEFYFISEVIAALPEHPVVVDCGAYIGDMFRQLNELNIEFDKWYCFELDSINYKRIEDLFKNTEQYSRMIIENKGLSDCTGDYFEERDGICSRIVDYETEWPVKLVSLDDYFDNDNKVDFIKMDIEGAEMAALKGGIETIRKQRPVMAICIYHRLFDYVDIIDYLNDALEDYRYLIRQHQWTLGKTVLYCIPE